MDVQALNYATQLISGFTEPLQSQCKKKSCKKSSVVKKLEFLCTAVGSVKCNMLHNGKQYEDS